jgi:hypothetical protein
VGFVVAASDPRGIVTTADLLACVWQTSARAVHAEHRAAVVAGVIG